MKEAQFFSNEEVRVILGSALPSERGQVALALFAAIRPETLQKLPAECINVADRTIHIPAMFARNRRAHIFEGRHTLKDGMVVPGIPDNLWTWLEEFPFTPCNWTTVQVRLKKALNGKWVHDGLRHTGATNYRALYGLAATGALLAHSSITLIGQHHDGLTTRAEAEAFFEITPTNVVFTAPKPSPTAPPDGTTNAGPHHQ